MSNTIFISKSSNDKEYALWLCQKLENYGYKCWISERDINEFEEWDKGISQAVRNCTYFIILVSRHSIGSGQVRNELRLASNYNCIKIPIRLDLSPLPDDFIYHLGTQMLNANKVDETRLFQLLISKMPISSAGDFSVVSGLEYVFVANHRLAETMIDSTDSVFSDVYDMGGFSWGQNKSIVQNSNGGWLLDQIIFEDIDWNLFEFKDLLTKQKYNSFYDSQEFQKEIRHGRNQTRWMLREYSTYQDKLFLSLQRTQWSQTQFTWHELLKCFDYRKRAITEFFNNGFSEYSNSLCLHVVLIDSENSIVATRIKRSKKNDYPATIAVTIGEQITRSDFDGYQTNEVIEHWLKRAMFEEFNLRENNYYQIIDTSSARIMALNMEGDIYNFSLVCCVMLKCTTEQLYDYYRVNRNSNDEFDCVFSISLEEVDNILANYMSMRSQYHPSSFLRLYFAKEYILKGENCSLL